MATQLNSDALMRQILLGANGINETSGFSEAGPQGLNPMFAPYVIGSPGNYSLRQPIKLPNGKTINTIAELQQYTALDPNASNYGMKDAASLGDPSKMFYDPNFGWMTESENVKDSNDKWATILPLAFAGAMGAQIVAGVAAGAGTGATLGNAGASTAMELSTAELSSLGYSSSEIAAMTPNANGMYSVGSLSTVGSNTPVGGGLAGDGPVITGNETLPGVGGGQVAAGGGSMWDKAVGVARSLGITAQSGISAIMGLLTQAGGDVGAIARAIGGGAGAGGLGSAVASIISAYGNWQAAKDWKDIIESESYDEKLNPFGSERGQYQEYLRDYYKDPLSAIQKMPGYEFTMNAALNSLDNKAGATRRFAGSAYPQWLQDRAGGVASQFANQYEQNLAKLAGADIGPQTYGGVVATSMEAQQRHQSSMYDALARAAGLGGGTAGGAPPPAAPAPGAPRVNIPTPPSTVPGAPPPVAPNPHDPTGPSEPPFIAPGPYDPTDPGNPGYFDPPYPEQLDVPGVDTFPYPIQQPIVPDNPSFGIDTPYVDTWGYDQGVPGIGTWWSN